MIFKIEIDTDDKDEINAILKCKENKRKIDELYEEVFRKHIKYGGEHCSYIYGTVWNDISDYLAE